jgi:hypothetical protein
VAAEGELPSRGQPGDERQQSHQQPADHRVRQVDAPEPRQRRPHALADEEGDERDDDGLELG